MKRLLAVALAGLALMLMACTTVSGNGTVVTENLTDLGSFDAVNIASSANANITIGETLSVRVTTDSNLLDVLEQTVNGGTLTLRTRNNTIINDYTELTYHITMPSLSAVQINGSGDINVSEMTSETLEAAIDGSGSIRLTDVTIDALTVRINGSGSVFADGTAETVTANINGSGDYRGFDLVASAATARINGSGTIEVLVEDALTGSINGSGDIVYRGDVSPQITFDGSGRLREDN